MATVFCEYFSTLQTGKSYETSVLELSSQNPSFQRGIPVLRRAQLGNNCNKLHDKSSIVSFRNNFIAVYKYSYNDSKQSRQVEALGIRVRIKVLQLAIMVALSWCHFLQATTRTVT
jgi:hypothetical protein